MTTDQETPVTDFSGALGGRNFPGPRPVDVALRHVEEAVAAARATEAPVGEILGRVANGLTGRVNGQVERAASAGMREAFERAVETGVRP